MLTSLASPVLVVDHDRLERNITAMAGRALELGVVLRPHAKTHKSPDVARLQLQAGAIGLTVATLSEAVVFAEAGVTDLFVGYPLWVDDTKAHAVRRLLDLGVDLTVGCDSTAAAQRLAPFGDRLRVLVEVDSGQHRSGVAAQDAGRLAGSMRDLGLDVAGVFTFPGHSYGPDARESAARDEETALSGAASALREHGVDPRVVSGGSTPSIGHSVGGVMTEARPGVYVFGDAQQWELGACTPDDIALTCLATVVSARPGFVVLDSGSKSLGADRAPWATGYGRLLDHPDARIVQLSEHHAVAAWPDGPQPSLGERLRVVPNHVCNTVNLADELVVVRAGEVVERWPVAARGANT
jgi:D-serine deaminase-like pyridoxal phosphate-dependent protein